MLSWTDGHGNRHAGGPPAGGPGARGGWPPRGLSWARRATCPSGWASWSPSPPPGLSWRSSPRTRWRWSTWTVGRSTEGLEPTSELSLHLGIYREYQAGAVVHTHAPMATALGLRPGRAAGDPLPPAGPGRPGGRRPVRDVRHARAGAGHDRGAARPPSRPDGQPRGDRVPQDAHAAVEDSLLLEWLCGVYWHAAALGTPRTLDPEQCQDVVQAVLERGYGETRERAE